MDDDREFQLARQFQLSEEAFFLKYFLLLCNNFFRIMAEIIQTAFPDRHDFRMLCKLHKFFDPSLILHLVSCIFGIEFMRVHPDGGEHILVLLRHRDRLPALLDGCPHADHLFHSCLPGAPNDRTPIRVVRFPKKMRMDIEHTVRESGITNQDQRLFDALKKQFCLLIL